tara:strand:+ start:1375 stop:2481 length:1107 start_codon:yes stop_codon:yes gene_type:complete
MIYDIAIIGAGCAGLSLAYQLSKKTNTKKKITILDNKLEFKKDRTWSFWKVDEHDFEDCLEKEWFTFNVKYQNQYKTFEKSIYPYQTIDSLKFYRKVQNELRNNFDLKLNLNIKSIKKKSNIFEISTNDKKIESKIVFDSRVPSNDLGNLYQHFYGYEINTNQNHFNENIVTLMDFDCEQKKGVHFFYILPFAANRALVETTWLSYLDVLDKKNYIKELESYIQYDLKIKDYNVIREEIGAIPMFRTKTQNEFGYFDIGLRGNINRMSTGYAFPYIQYHSRVIANAIENLSYKKAISSKYEFFDRLFIKVLKNNITMMPNIFFNIFNEHRQNQVIRFLSSKGSLFDDYQVIKNMPKKLFLKNLLSDGK